jgi:sugar lactone lactonase YvrE
LLLCVIAAPAHAQNVTFAYTQTTVGSGLSGPFGLAVDGAGDVFIADQFNNRVVEVPAGCTSAACQTTVPASGLNEPAGVAVDGAGNVFIADTFNHQVVKVPAGGGAQTTVVSGLGDPYGVAVDRAGDVFIGDVFLGVLEVPAGGGAQLSVGTGLVGPKGVAVDAAGDVFIADRDNNRVVEVPVACLPAACQTTVGSGLSYPVGVGVDGAGDVFIGDFYNSRVVEVPYLGGGSYGTQTTVPTSGLHYPQGVAVDAAGDVFISDAFDSEVLEVQRVAVNFGDVSIGAKSTLTLNYSVAATTTFGTPKVLTQGAANLDFTLGAGGTCTGTITGGSTCTLNVTFAPLAPGLREGAVQLFDNSGNLLATTLVHGIGQGPAIAFGLGVQTGVSGVNLSEGVAVDAAGDVFYSAGGVYELPAGCTTTACQKTVGSGLGFAVGVAVDGAGDVFIADDGNNNVVKVPLGCTSTACQTTVGSGLNQAQGVAVDGMGDVFIADSGHNRVVEVPAGCTTAACQTVVVSGIDYPTGVAVDGAGDVFAAYGTGIIEVPPGCTTAACQITVGSGLEPFAVAVDGAGDVFVADYGNSRAVEVPAGCTSAACQTTIGSGLGNPEAVAVDGAGDIYLGGNELVEINRSQPPSFTFAPTLLGQTSTDSPQSVTVQNIGNQPLNAVAPGLVVNGPNFVKVAGSGTPADCTSSFSLSPGATCNLSISFKPTSASNLNSTAVFTDNALNASPSASQTIALKGTLPGPIASITPSIWDFGTVYLGSISTESFTLKNTGGAAMTLTDPLISILKGGNSSEFLDLNLCPKSLAAGSSCTVWVTFVAGPFYGEQTANLSIVDNAIGSPQTVSLMANVIDPLATLSPTSLSFGTVKVNSSTTKSVTLSNPGSTALTIAKTAISGTNSADFTIGTSATACGSSLNAGKSCTISVAFKPGAKGSRSATLTVTDNARTATQTVPLTGTGN